VCKLAWLCTMKIHNENLPSRGVGKISGLSNRLLYECLGFAATIILTIFICRVNVVLLLNKLLHLPQICSILWSEIRQNKLLSECQCFCCETSSLSGSFSLSAIQGSPQLTWQHESLCLGISLLHTGNCCPGSSLANTTHIFCFGGWGIHGSH
jgi:hypothetical protein